MKAANLENIFEGICNYLQVMIGICYTKFRARNAKVNRRLYTIGINNIKWISVIEWPTY